MTIEEMKARKRELGYSNKMIAELSGVPLGTVQKIFAGMTSAPRRETVMALEKLLSQGLEEGRDDRRHHEAKEYGIPQPDPSFCVREDGAEYNPGTSAYELPEKRLYTIDDYYALPDERRVELIDGLFYDMPVPNNVHQALLGQLFLHFAPCVEGHPECELFFAPLDVRLDNDNFTMVQPDLLIVCNREDEDRRRINGAPDFVLEILSPSNRFHDLFRKLAKYSRAHVREYWIVDPENRKVVVYHLEQGDLPETYSFQDRIPVGISKGECTIDFAAITVKVNRYLD